MSNNQFTPNLYANPLIGLIPADTAENLVYASALLMKLDQSDFDHDEAMGLFRTLEAMHAAAHHLHLALPEPVTSQPADSAIPAATDLDRPHSVWIALSETTAVKLSVIADRRAQSLEEAAAGLLCEALAQAGAL